MDVELAISSCRSTDITRAGAGACISRPRPLRTHPAAEICTHVLCQLALQQRRERSESDGLAGLLRAGSHGTHHGVDAAAAHAFPRLQAQYC